MPTPVSPQQEAKYLEGISRTEEFFMGRGRVRRAHDEIVERLRDAQIPYAIIGAIALNEYGYERATKDVAVLLTREGLDEFKKRWLGRGYLERFPGSRGMRDTRNGVDIDIVIAGDYPGDGKPKSVRFPDPQIAARPGPRGNLLPLETAIELKLASGMSAPRRPDTNRARRELRPHSCRSPRPTGCDQSTRYLSLGPPAWRLVT
jgi:hypothetical protein